jgi:pimeloyl-ACP methyl ester carboxylesterase
METPFQAYSGDEPYVFVCYAHEDGDIVYPEMVWLREQGTNLWYDEGISAGKNWRSVIGDSLLGARHVLFYISERSLKSDHCNREINLALDEGKDVVPVYLEDVELTSDLKVGLNRVHALHRDQDASYQPHLLNALGQSTVESQPGVTHDPAAANRSRRGWSTMATAASVLLAVVFALGYYYRDTLLLTLALNAPVLYYGEPIDQQIGFATTPDGTRIAYATSGEGPPIVQVIGWGTHLESGQESALYDTLGVLAMSSRDHLFVRYDGRGFGLSDRDVDDFSLQARVSDLEAVVDALGLERFGLFAISAGGQAAIVFAAQHPERVTRLVLAATGASMDYLSEAQREAYERANDLFEVDWQNPAVSDMQASLVLRPGGDEFDRRLLGEMMRRSGDGAAVAGVRRALSREGAREQAKRITVPTLVIQGKNSALVPIEAARDLIALIPGSQLEIVEGSHMVGSGNTPAVRRRILDFFEMEQ